MSDEHSVALSIIQRDWNIWFWTKFPVSGFGGAISYSDYHDFFEIKAVSAYGNISRFLNVEEDTPLLYSDGITYGIQKDREVPIELFQNYYLTSRFEYSLIQRR